MSSPSSRVLMPPCAIVGYVTSNLEYASYNLDYTVYNEDGCPIIAGPEY